MYHLATTGVLSNGGRRDLRESMKCSLGLASRFSALGSASIDPRFASMGLEKKPRLPLVLGKRGMKMLQYLAGVRAARTFVETERWNGFRYSKLLIFLATIDRNPLHQFLY